MTSLLSRWHRFALAWLALFLCAGMARAGVISTDHIGRPIAMETAFEYWMDANASASVDQVAERSAGWLPAKPAGQRYDLNGGQALWLKVQIKGMTERDRWYLDIPYPALDRVTLFTRDEAGQWVLAKAGDSLPVSQWAMPHLYPLLPLSFLKQEGDPVPQLFLLKVENRLGFGARLSMVSETHLAQHELVSNFSLGAFFGLALMALVFAVLSAATLRDAAFGYYALFLLLQALSCASLSGVAGFLLWPDQARWNDTAPYALPVLAAMSAMPLVSALFSVTQRSPVGQNVLRGMTLLGMLTAFGITLIETRLRFHLVVVYVALVIVVASAVMVWARWRGDRFAWPLLACSLPMMVVLIALFAQLGGHLTIEALNMGALLFAIGLQIAGLLVLLTLRSQQHRENQRRIHGLDRIDPATGLITEHVFSERLRRMIARSTRSRCQSVVLLMDIANQEQIQYMFGRKSAEELPLQVAARLLAVARDIDSVARLSERRFAMLIEGPLATEEIKTAGQRMIARCLMPFEGKGAEWIAQLRVAQAVVPEDGTQAATVLGQLMLLLENMETDSKSAVFSLSQDPESEFAATVM